MSTRPIKADIRIWGLPAQHVKCITVEDIPHVKSGMNFAYINEELVNATKANEKKKKIVTLYFVAYPKILLSHKWVFYQQAVFWKFTLIIYIFIIMVVLYFI